MSTQLLAAAAAGTHRAVPRRRKHKATPIDGHVGARLREARLTRGLSQTGLGSRIGLTFQQVQKYERGTNRISAGVLWQLAETLDVPVSFFFDGLGAGTAPRDPASDGRADCAEMIRAYRAIQSPAARAALRAVARALAGEPEGGDA